MKKLIAAAAAAAIAAGAFAVPSFSASTTKRVSIKDNVFAPTSVTIRKGQKIKWTWKGHAPHNVTATKGPVKFHSTTKTSGTFTKKFTKKGKYTILCTIHAPGMKMVVRVK